MKFKQRMTMRKPPNTGPLKQSPKQQRLNTIYKFLSFLKSSDIVLMLTHDLGNTRPWQVHLLPLTTLH